jgi:ABC-type multidrug transport system ATPase subunit
VTLGPVVTLRVDRLHKAFSSDRTPALAPRLSDVTFHACRHEILGVCGSVGCGKTTLLRCVAGLMRPDSGNIVWFGARFPGGGCVPGLSYVPKAPEYYPFLTVRDALEYHVDIDVSAPASRSAAITDALCSVGLGDLIDAHVRDLDQSKVVALALAEALAPSPRAIVIDGTLDSAQRRELLGIGKALVAFATAGGTVIIASRRSEIMAALANRVLVMECGRIVGESLNVAELSSMSEDPVREDERIAARLVAERWH